MQAQELRPGEQPRARSRTSEQSSNDGSAEVSTVADRIRREFLTRIDLADLLTAAQ